MSASEPLSAPEQDQIPKDFSSVTPQTKRSLPLWLMILLAAFTAIVLIWVMLIMIYPSIALS